MNGPWAESMSSTVNVPDDTIEIFKVFETWLYTQNIALDAQQKNGYRFTIDLFIFANKYQAHEFQNACMDLLYQRFKESRTLCTPLDICYIWLNTVQHSPLRAYLIHLYTYDCLLRDVIDAQDLYPKSFVRNVLDGFIARVPTRFPGERTPYENSMAAYYVWEQQG